MTKKLNSKVHTDIDISNENLIRNINFSLLFIHIGLCISFILMDTPIMIVTNIVSIATYILLFYIINKNLVAYLLVVYLEILIHMTIASLCLGWKCGFQLYFFSFIPVIYYCDYISKKRNIMKIYTIPMSIVVIAVFLILRIFSLGDYAVYSHLSETTCSILYIINIIVTFFFIMLFMAMFERMSLRNEAMMQHMAEYDLLTNLSNRLRMTSIFNKLGEKKIEHSVAILDIDNFKKVNDTYGHNVGDAALVTFANILKGIENDEIYACRWGGEEFLVVVSGKNTYEQAKKLLEKIRIDISKTCIPTDDGELYITVSCGIAKWDLKEKSSKTIHRADAYLYKAKHNGKNQIIANDNEEP